MLHVPHCVILVKRVNISASSVLGPENGHNSH
jgi:hypothetical protein